MPDAKYPTPEKQVAFMASLMERMQGLAGVQSAGAGLGLPLSNYWLGTSFTIDGHPTSSSRRRSHAREMRVATPDRFSTMGIKVVKGRGFTDEDRAGGRPVLIVTEAAAKQFFPHEDPIGKHVKTGAGHGTSNLEGDVIGIVSDVKQASLAASVVPQFWSIVRSMAIDDVDERRAAHDS